MRRLSGNCAGSLVGHYDIEQRVCIVAGPHRHCTGITVTCYDGDPESRAVVLVRLDTSDRIVSVEAREIRAMIYHDMSGIEGAT